MGEPLELCLRERGWSAGQTRAPESARQGPAPESVKETPSSSPTLWGSQRALAGRSDLQQYPVLLGLYWGEQQGSTLSWSQHAQSVGWGEGNVPSWLLRSQSTGDRWPSLGTGHHKPPPPTPSHLRYPSVANPRAWPENIPFLISKNCEKTLL